MNEKRKLKRWRFAHKTLDRIVIVVLAVIMLLGVYTVYDSMYLLGYTTKNLAYFFEGDKEDWDRMPDNAFGWLTIDDTNINYPVMQGKDNEEYLNKDAFGQYALTGSIFLDFRNDPGWNDDYNLLYGHHMAADQMFGSLDNFKEKAYFDTHTTGILKTREADYSLYVFAVIKTGSDNEMVFGAGSDGHDKEVPAYLKENALLYREPKDIKILAMSTCQETGTTERLLVFASMTKIREPGTLYDTDNIIEPKDTGGK